MWGNSLIHEIPGTLSGGNRERLMQWLLIGFIANIPRAYSKVAQILITENLSAIEPPTPPVPQHVLGKRMFCANLLHC